MRLLRVSQVIIDQGTLRREYVIVVLRLQSSWYDLTMDKRSVCILGGGTVAHVSSHLALSAPAYGVTARILSSMVRERFNDVDVKLFLTRMAGRELNSISLGETNADVEVAIADILATSSTKIIFMSSALCDFEPSFPSGPVGKHVTRLHSRSDARCSINLTPAKKVIGTIRRARKDIFLVGFKTTCGATEDEQYIAGLGLLKEAACNLVLVNDVKSRMNMIVTPEEARYHITADRIEVLKHLVDMTWHRSHLTFTRSIVIEGDRVRWHDPLVPAALRTVVDHCISRGAYKPFRGSTVGHFASKIDDQTFLTSIRKSNFNDIDANGLVLVKAANPDSVVAYGAKPSVGGQSQRLVFRDHPGMDCIVHFHCPIKQGSAVPVRSQREYECGSHQCGQNTSDGLKSFGNIKAVYLDHHGPNVVFNRGVDPAEVISFIESNFDLSGKTGGPVDLGSHVNEKRESL